ncbi:MAG: hypothetical protein WD649_01165 [Thermoleophilaceae bacterium]
MAALLAVAAIAGGCGGDEESKSGQVETGSRPATIAVAPRPRRDPRLYEAHVARGSDLAEGGRAAAGREFIVGKPVGLRFRGPLGARARYEVCVTGPQRKRRCRHGRTTGTDRFTTLEYPARGVGAYVARWLVAGKQVAEWAYAVRPRPKPKRRPGPTETVPLRERYPELGLPRRERPRGREGPR